MRGIIAVAAILAGLAWLSLPASAGKIQRYTDEEGTIHIMDTEPEGRAKTAPGPSVAGPQPVPAFPSPPAPGTPPPEPEAPEEESEETPDQEDAEEPESPPGKSASSGGGR